MPYHVAMLPISRSRPYNHYTRQGQGPRTETLRFVFGCIVCTTMWLLDLSRVRSSILASPSPRHILCTLGAITIAAGSTGQAG